MFAVPALTPVTAPVPATTVATARSELLQLPPPSPVVVYVFEAPIQSGVVPEIIPPLTFGLTVNVKRDEVLQPGSV